MKTVRSDFLIAAAVILCTLVLLGALSIAISGTDLNRPKALLTVDLPSAVGLDRQAQVRYAGTIAGRIRSIRPLTDTLDLYHSQGVDPRVMSAAIKHMSERYPEAGPQIVAMERRGQYGFNVRVQVTTEADKSALSADYFAKYKQFKALAEAEKQTLIARLDVNMIKAR